MRFVLATLPLFLAAYAAEAACLPPASSACVPEHPLAREFVTAIAESYSCDDAILIDDHFFEKPRRLNAVEIFARKHGQYTLPFYEDLLRACRGSNDAASHALDALAVLGTPEAAKVLLEQVRSGGPGRQCAAAYALSRIEAGGATEVAALLRSESTPRTRACFRHAVLAHADRTAAPALREAIATAPDPEERRELTNALGLIENPGYCVFEADEPIAGRRWYGRAWPFRQCRYECRPDRGFWPDWTYEERFVLSRCPALVPRPLVGVWAPPPPSVWSRPSSRWAATALWSIAAALGAIAIWKGLVRRTIRVPGRTAVGREAIYLGILWLLVAATLAAAGYAAWVWPR